MVISKCDKCGKKVDYAALHKKEETGYCDLCGSCYDEYYKGREEVLKRYRTEFFSFLNRNSNEPVELQGTMVGGIYYPANCHTTELCGFCVKKDNCSLLTRGEIKS